jgi:hypothetical protein
MVSRAEDWRVEGQDQRIDRLEGDLRKAQEKIRELERRPIEWLLKAELAIVWLLVAVVWVFALVEIANKH